MNIIQLFWQVTHQCHKISVLSLWDFYSLSLGFIPFNSDAYCLLPFRSTVSNNLFLGFLFYLCLVSVYFSTTDSQTTLISTFLVCIMSWLAAECAYCIHITAFYKQCLCLRHSSKNAEKDLLTTLSSCCNSMRAGMQQKEGKHEKKRESGGGGREQER